MGKHIGSREEWITVSKQILRAPPERLQGLLLEISKRHPGMSFYATDLARLRMAGREKARQLEELWQARRADHIDAIVHGRSATTDPASRALAFLASLVRRELEKNPCREASKAGRDTLSLREHL